MQKQASCQHNERKNADLDGNGMIQVGDKDVNKDIDVNKNRRAKKNKTKKLKKNPWKIAKKLTTNIVGDDH